MPKPKRSPRDGWRINIDGPATHALHRLAKEGPCCFDEIVVGKWLHLERLDDNLWCIRIGDRCGCVLVDGKGAVAGATWDGAGPAHQKRRRASR